MKSAGAFKPFRHLKQMLQRNATPVETLPAERFPLTASKDDAGDTDATLFERAMADVTPLRKTDSWPAPCPHPPRQGRMTDEAWPLEALRELVRTGRGYRVADTPEYIEGTGYRVPPGITRELHRGTFSIQAHIDLHGMTVPVAREAVNAFLQDAVQRGFSAVLIVHGRGLSSAAEPVLKTGLVRWLTTGTRRKSVKADASAPPCDGGAGATYVLLRQRPLTKRQRR